MRNLKHFFTALLLLCYTIATAEEVTIDGIKYDVVTKAKIATVIAGDTEYYGDIIIPSEITHNDVTCSVTSIGNRAFSWCFGLTSITIPNSVTSIGEYAFYLCTGLTSITIPNSVTSIGDWAFRDCSGLTSIEILNSVTSIGENAFEGCSGLTSIEIPNSVTSIGDNAFRDCTGLASVTIGNSVASIGSSAFYGCSGLTSITIPNSVASIGSSAFYGCSGLTSITIPNSVTSIGNRAFSGCSGLASIEIPNSVTSIGYEAFAKCSGLASVTIGSGVKSIFEQAFANCSSLTDVYCLATTAPSTDEIAFEESYPEYMTLHVPAEAVESYRATAPWSSFGTIVTLDGEEVETPKCATPVISYVNGKVSITCETEGAEFTTTVTNDYAKTYYDNTFDLAAAYSITVYAMATGYDNSETVNATLFWVENGNSDNETDIINIPANAVFVTSNAGVIYVSYALDGENVAVYTTAGVLIEETVIANGNATLQSGLEKDSVAIVKIGERAVKVVVD